MKTKINNREVYIKWKHNNNTPNGNPEQVISNEPSSTECWIEDFETGDLIGKRVVAKMHYTDKNYCKDTGRRVSLGRVLSTIVIGKVDRTRIWSEYFETCKSPKKPRLANAVKSKGLSTSMA